MSFQRRGARDRGTITGATSLEAVSTFAAEIAGLTDAKILKASYVEMTYLDIGPENPNVSAFGITDYVSCQLKRHTRTGSGDYREVHIFAPKMDILEHIGKNYRLKRAIGVQIAAAYSVMVGDTFDFREGWVCGYSKDDQGTGAI